MAAGSGRDEEQARARAKLDQVREEGGMPLRGDEVASRAGQKDPGLDDPPLDWRLTPRNVILQLAAVALFIGVVWFLVALVTDSLSALFG